MVPLRPEVQVNNRNWIFQIIHFSNLCKYIFLGISSWLCYCILFCSHDHDDLEDNMLNGHKHDKN